jgi:hypothetical protein
VRRRRNKTADLDKGYNAEMETNYTGLLFYVSAILKGDDSVSRSTRP